MKEWMTYPVPRNTWNHGKLKRWTQVLVKLRRCVARWHPWPPKSHLGNQRFYPRRFQAADCHTLAAMTKHHTAESYPKVSKTFWTLPNKPHIIPKSYLLSIVSFYIDFVLAKFSFMLHVPGRVAGSCPRPHTEQCNACLEEIISTVMSRIKQIHCWKKIHQKACEGSHGKPRSTNPWRCKS